MRVHLTRELTKSSEKSKLRTAKQSVNKTILLFLRRKLLNASRLATRYETIKRSIKYMAGEK